MPGKDIRSVWMLSGIALSLAQAMGMHSDSASFHLDSIETEVRRRVWWMLCQIDITISDDCGLESHVPWSMDTKLPLNVNDADLNSSRGAIIPGSEFTEMTPTLVKIEMAEVNLKVQRARHEYSPRVFEEIENLAQEKTRRFENIYLFYLDDTSHLIHLCHLGLRLMLSKLWKIKYDALLKQNKLRREESLDSLLYFNADLLEITYQYPERTEQYGWFFRCKHWQWHAMATLLVELCKGYQGPAASRARAVLDVVFGEPEDDGSATNAGTTTKRNQTRSSPLWEPMSKLKRALDARNRILRAESLSSDTFSSDDSGYSSTTTTPIVEEEPIQPALDGEALLGDPFLSSNGDIIEDMSWEQLDAWLESFQPDLLDQIKGLNSTMDGVWI